MIKLERIGKNGRKIHIFKLRTMYPYAKYLQKNLLDQFGFNENGKINNDFRITKTGRILRKYYIDEIPQIINLLKGDISFIGCRPLSRIFLEYYPREIYTLRLKFKPGIISPAISDNASTVKDVIESEYHYLLRLENNPFKTKFRIFIKAFANVITRKINSQ
ncbi:MAG: sugar transferase [Bacteroidales bacterium]|nr:sugar transferase [Bacteroidales bacterium]